MLMCGAASTAQADVGKVGASGKPMTIQEAAENKRIRDQVERVLKRREDAKNKADKDAADQALKDKAASDAEKGIVPDATGPTAVDVPVSPGAAKADKTQAAADAPVVPALVIQFNHNYVNFDRELRHMLETSERSKKAVHYNIISEVPDLSTTGRRNDRTTAAYEDNLNRVVDQFSQMGVQPSRVSVSSRPNDKVTAQTVSIYQD